MPDGELATQGVFAESWEPLGDGQAPWSFWQQAASQGKGSGNGAVKEVRHDAHGDDVTGRRTCERKDQVSATRERSSGRNTEMTYLDAISDALRFEMRRDETVFCLGEDVGAFGGAFKVTNGFVEEFGEERCLDMPLAENTIVGASIGVAIEGMKPVAEMQFADFIACGFDQLVNVAAKLHYRQGIAVPMVVRLPSGGGFSGGPFHSQNPEAWFAQTRA